MITSIDPAPAGTPAGTPSAAPVGTGRGPVVVALHSSGAGARQWAAWQELLPPATTLITPDLIGYEAGSAWSAGTPVTLEQEARRIAELIEPFTQGVHLLGHSYGGVVALNVALRWPLRVRSLALYEPVLFTLLRDGAAAHGAGPGLYGAGEAGDDDLDADARAWREITGVGSEIAALAGNGQRADAAARFLDYWSGTGTWAALTPRRQAAVAARMPKVAAEFGALFHDPLPLAACRRLHLPVRLAAGERSPLPARRIVARLARLLPQVAPSRLAGLGHMGPLEAPARVAQALGLVDMAAARPALQAA